MAKPLRLRKEGEDEAMATIDGGQVSSAGLGKHVKLIYRNPDGSVVDQSVTPLYMNYQPTKANVGSGLLYAHPDANPDQGLTAVPTQPGSSGPAQITIEYAVGSEPKRTEVIDFEVVTGGTIDIIV